MIVKGEERRLELNVPNKAQIRPEFKEKSERTWTF